MEKARAKDFALIEWGCATQALPGETVSGDLHLVKPFRNGILVAVVDGVGHGAEATAAAKTAVATLAEYPMESVIWLVRRCHDFLARSRGVVMTLASFHAIEGTLTWLGVGNVSGILLRADTKAVPASEQVLLRGGLVGFQLPPLYAGVVPVFKNDLLILASDGVRSEFIENCIPSKEPAQAMADRILLRAHKGNDDALVLVARYRGPRHE